MFFWMFQYIHSIVFSIIRGCEMGRFEAQPLSWYVNRDALALISWEKPSDWGGLCFCLVQPGRWICSLVSWLVRCRINGCLQASMLFLKKMISFVNCSTHGYGDLFWFHVGATKLLILRFRVRIYSSLSLFLQCNELDSWTVRAVNPMDFNNVNMLGPLMMNRILSRLSCQLVVQE